jgi:hypothetical protein
LRRQFVNSHDDFIDLSEFDDTDSDDQLDMQHVNSSVRL